MMQVTFPFVMSPFVTSVFRTSLHVSSDTAAKVVSSVDLNSIGDVPPALHTSQGTHQEAADQHTAFLGLDSYGWVAVSFVLFFLVLLKVKTPSFLLNFLDGHAKKIRLELEEAQSLRQEAEALLAQYQERHRQVDEEVSNILAQAHLSADSIVEASRQQAEIMISRRTQMTETKIKALENRARTQLQNHFVDMVTSAAEKLIVESGTVPEKKKILDASLKSMDKIL